MIYLIPIIFLVISYFFLTASGEDIYQGAGNVANGGLVDPIADAVRAFLFNSRVTDMYAWAVIDFYDYQYSFGVDTIFRLVDVLVSLAVFYVATCFILERRPKLNLKDALIFTGFFALFMIMPFARPFYEEFSMIHNYPPLILATLLFSIPYLKLVLRRPPKKHLKLLAVLMFCLGLYFGAATTVTPIAFLVTLAIYCVLRRKKIKQLPAWFFTGIAGVVGGLVLTQVVFSATNHYMSGSTAEVFDFLAFSTLLENPLASIITIIKHTFYNFGIVLLPLGLVYAFFALLTRKPRFYFSKQFFYSLSGPTRRFYAVCLAFIFVHLIGLTQIMAPFRLLMPPFLIGLILVFKVFCVELNSKILGVFTVIFAMIILVVHSVFLIQYHGRMAVILDEIKNSKEQNICLEKSRTLPRHIKISNLNQVNMIVDWGVPEIIYGKNITFCEEK